MHEVALCMVGYDPLLERQSVRRREFIASVGALRRGLQPHALSRRRPPAALACSWVWQKSIRSRSNTCKHYAGRSKSWAGPKARMFNSSIGTRPAIPLSHAHMLAIMTNIGSPIGALEMSEAQAAAYKLGLEVLPLEIRRAEDIAPAFEALRGDAQALYVVSEPLAGTNMVRINTLALGLRLPTVHGLREYAEAGGLMSYGPNIPDLFRRAADYVDKILRGAKPGDIPVEQPTKFDLVINLTTAKALGLTIPESILARADELIE